MTEPTIGSKITRVIIGDPKDPRDPGAFHKLSLIAILAWVGLGADGLSSSAYGPEEAFRALGDHIGLAVFLALATAVTVLIISASYSRIIEQFPAGGGGYAVASKLLGEPVGVLAAPRCSSTTSSRSRSRWPRAPTRSAASFPRPGTSGRCPFAFVGLAILLVLNLRGVKESVTTIAPVFGLFLVTHAVMFVAMIVEHLGDFGDVAGEVEESLGTTISTLGVWGTLWLFARAYSLGGGTYTGIEAVSNGVAMMREPRVATAKRRWR